ncbi:hypothetical protein O3P69_011705 [Scylla paramamosain]|uniref:Uncharacterized protein n=1 Tax=Scylla paramamosain TaxID=85552 RepID=A0AAW0SLS1_SCYPA
MVLLAVLGPRLPPSTGSQRHDCIPGNRILGSSGSRQGSDARRSGKARQSPKEGENHRLALAVRSAVYNGVRRQSRAQSKLAVVTVVAGFCLLAVGGEPEPEAGAGYVGGHHSYHPVVVHPGYYGHNRYGRSAEPEPEADAEPGFRGRGYGYHSRPYYHGYSHVQKRSAEPEPKADAEPSFRSRGCGYQSLPYYHSYSYVHKRSAEPEAYAEPCFRGRGG